MDQVFEGELFQAEPYNKEEIIKTVKNLLDINNYCKKIEKYKNISKIYCYLAANKQFVLDHTKFFNTFLGNANSLINTIIRDYDTANKEEEELMCKLTCTIIDSVSTITNN